MKKKREDSSELEPIYNYFGFLWGPDTALCTIHYIVLEETTYYESVFCTFLQTWKGKRQKSFKTIKMSEIIVQVSEDHFSSQIRGGHAMLQCK